DAGQRGDQAPGFVPEEMLAQFHAIGARRHLSIEPHARKMVIAGRGAPRRQSASGKGGRMTTHPIARYAVSATVMAAALGGSAFHASGRTGDAERDGDVRYQVVHLSSFGGKVNRGNSINDEGWVAGYSNLAGDTSRHARLWARGFGVDLGM